MEHQISHVVFYPFKAERVWQYLTRAELLEKWLMKNDFEPVVGRTFEFRTSAMPHLDLDGIFKCKVLESKPFSSLSYSWTGGPKNGQTSVDSLVRWTLEEVDGGTRLYLLHTGFDESNVLLRSLMDAGWLSNMKKVTGLLETEANDVTTG